MIKSDKHLVLYCSKERIMDGSIPEAKGGRHGTRLDPEEELLTRIEQMIDSHVSSDREKSAMLTSLINRLSARKTSIDKTPGPPSLTPPAN